jgi:hypothetical protein
MRTDKATIAAILARPLARRVPLTANSHANNHAGERLAVKEKTSVDRRAISVNHTASGGATATHTRNNAR